MAYSGFLLRLSDGGSKSYTFPHKYIKAESYSAYVNMQDVDPYTDANGYLHREPVELKAFKCEFETVSMLKQSQLDEIMNGIRNVFTQERGRQLYITAFVPETGGYVTQYGYLADFTPQMYAVWDDEIYYNPIRFAFIGGVYNG